MKNIFKITILAVAASFVVSCDLTENNPNTISPALAFKTEENVWAALVPFVGQTPSLTSVYSDDFGESDYVIASSTSTELKPGYVDNWEQEKWTDLRNINYFINTVNSGSCALDVAKKANYSGMGRFYRAFWYFNMLKEYGDLPIIDHVLVAVNTDDVYQNRASRDKVVEFIVNDCDFGYNNITHISVDKTTPDKWCALFLKMRVCLYEASFRKYNNVTKSASGEAFSKYSVNDLYKMAAEAAQTLMNDGGFDLVSNYRDLFTSDVNAQPEVLLGAATGTNISGSQNYYFGYANSKSFVRPFINTYLMKDGSFYSSKAGFETETFDKEFENRDPRLAKTVRTPGYLFKKYGADKTAVTPDIYNSTAPLGYQIIKHSYDYALHSSPEEEAKMNDNCEPIFRYAEVLLTLAEAKAELGQMDNAVWAKTIGAIRARAGITGTTLSTVPTAVDSYLQTKFYPNVKDAAILEIRRERGVEMCLEGLRHDDIYRWGCANLVADPDLWDGVEWTGVNFKLGAVPVGVVVKPGHIEGPVNIDGRTDTGVDDAGNDFYVTDRDAIAILEDEALPADYKTVIVRVNQEDGYLKATTKDGITTLSYDIDAANRFWTSDNRQILNPIPQATIERYVAHGYKFSQNPGY